MTAPPASQFDQAAFGVAAFVELLKNGFEIAAIIVGGIWTYFNYFKGRTYRLRLECEVEGSIETQSGRSLLKVVVRTKNVGLSKVPIGHEGTILQLHSAVATTTSPSWPCQVMWSDEPTAVFDVFKDHDSVEPSEPIEDQVLAELPDDEAPAYKLTLKVLSKKLFWTAKTIVQGSAKHRTKGGICGEGVRSEASGPE
ncbi:MAG: hypothetical protein WCC04_21760 [Terriglobales bacterium]